MLNDEQSIVEVTIRELHDRTSEALRRARDGERLIVTRHGHPIALIVGLEDAIDLYLAGSERLEVMRREARADLESGRTVNLEDLRPRRRRVG